MVVAQLVEQSIPIPEIRGSNPVIGKKTLLNIYCQLYWKDEVKKKRPGMTHFTKSSIHAFSFILKFKYADR